MNDIVSDVKKIYRFGFKKPYTKAEAWIWMLFNAKAREEKEFINFGGKERLVTTPRGSFTHSLRDMAKAFGWSVEKVKRYMARLENESMVSLKQVQQITQVTIVNYDSYGNGKLKASTVKVQQRDSKKVKEKIEIPDWEEFSAYAKSVKHNVDVENMKAKYDAWVLDGWKDGKGKKITNWKSKIGHNIQYWGVSETYVSKF